MSAQELLTDIRALEEELISFERKDDLRSDVFQLWSAKARRRQFLQTFLERDIPQLGITIPSAALRRFWNMVAHYHGQTWNGAELARALAVGESTVRRYLDLMTEVFMVWQLPPWFGHPGKRQVKAPTESRII